MAKHIFVTGGVVSSLGKGLTSASIGLLLESWGISIRIQKIDPYINVDPGTMSPFQHGEVYVTEDGAETDLDLGHYERFTKALITKECNFTTGSIYNSVISKERRGEYLGKTVQVVPHITDEIKSAILRGIDKKTEILISEIGGTVGDIEGLPFLEAIRQFGLEFGRENVLYIHLTLLPYIHGSEEIKTKPTQHSVGRLREIGIVPDIIICRTEKPINNEIKEKISLFCNVPVECVFEEKDVDYSIYEVPVVLNKQGLDRRILERFRFRRKRQDFNEWKRILRIIKNPRREVSIALVGKYTELQDAYKSIYEALEHGGIANNCKVNIKRIKAKDIEKKGAKSILKNVCGVLVPGGFGERGISGKIKAVKFAREDKVPFLGICLGLQCAVIEFARNVLKLDANSSEFDKQTKHPVIALMDEQVKVTKKGGTMRLGSYPCILEKKSFSFKAYKNKKIHERHRHRYEFNNKYREQFIGKGMNLAGVSPDGKLVEIIELPNHPWFVATQFHPEFKSKPTNAHPLFREFVKAAIKKKKG